MRTSRRRRRASWSRAPRQQPERVPDDVATPGTWHLHDDVVVDAGERVDGGEATGDIPGHSDPRPSAQRADERRAGREQAGCAVDLEPDQGAQTGRRGVRLEVGLVDAIGVEVVEWQVDAVLD